MNDRHIISIPDNNFDFLRLLFAGMVAIAHFLSLSGEDHYTEIAKYFDTNVAVKGFFILSGCLVCSSFLKSGTLSGYFIKRAKRLLPAYISVVLIAAIALCTISEYPVWDYFIHPQWRRYLGFNLVFLNFIQPSLPGVFTHNPFDSVNGSLWTIKIEVSFYLLLPVFLFFLKKTHSLKRINLFIGLLYLSSFLYRGILDLLMHNAPQWQPLYNQFPAFMEYFSVGIFAYYNRDWLLRNLSFLIWPGIFILLANYFLGFSILFPIGLGIVIFYFAYIVRKHISIRIKHDFSYSLYLVHYPIVQVLIYSGIYHQSIWKAFILYTLLLVTCCCFFWFCIERPFLRRKKELPKK